MKWKKKWQKEIEEEEEDEGGYIELVEGEEDGGEWEEKKRALMEVFG